MGDSKQSMPSCKAPRILVGADLGKTTVSVAIAEIADDETPNNTRCFSERHLGRPVEVFAKWYRELHAASLLGIAATGIYSNRLAPPVITGLPEEMAQEYAASNLYPGSGALNVVRLGGRGYSILTRNELGHFNFEENDKCSAGTGETIEKICSRMGLTLEEAVALAEAATGSIPITARCSVFAKSEMTHFANQGERKDFLLRGYFESVARNIFALYDKWKVPGPVVLVGNGALIGPLCTAFANMAKVPVTVSEQAGVFEALGALYYAVERSWDDIPEWPGDPKELVGEKKRRISSLRPADRMGGKVIRLESGPERAADHGSPAILGLDLGSTGSKAALIDASSGTVIADVYRRTEGNPVEVSKALVADILKTVDRPVAGIGLTGSGRDAAATIFRAAYPESESAIYVQNEIVAHATAAIRCDPDKGRSLSIVEIGGQDAKFINIENGRILESDMNRACSAGTGSFLEEQGVFYGLDDISHFGEIAARSSNPPDLGQMCTVFVADLAAEALNEGYTLEDIFAGFQYSVIMNYKNRVMGNRRFMDRIIFQGKPASNPSLARTLAAITGREVYVPANPGAMGAVGIALMAAQSLDNPENAPPIDLEKILAARVIDRREFRCRDPKCDNLCRVESATVEVGGKKSKVVSGGNCPKYEAKSAGWRKLPKDAPNPYRERSKLLEKLCGGEGVETGPRLALPYGHHVIDYLPFFHEFFSKLGLRVRIVRSDRDTLYRGNVRCSANNTCTPCKIMHGLACAEADYLFLPKFVELPRLVKNSGAATCPVSQAAPDMIGEALKAEGAGVEILKPHFHLGERGFETPRFVEALRDVTRKLLGRLEGLRKFKNAYRHALAVQQEYEKGLAGIGARALDFARREGYPVVLIVGNSHVIHEPVMNAGIHELVTANGAVALPLDCFPIPETVPPFSRVYWGVANRLMRACCAAAMAGDVFPLMIESYGCGPSSFTERLFNDLLEHYPHTVLESDGHGGKAGYITRVQAFLHTVRSYEKGGGRQAVPSGKISRYDRLPAHSVEKLRSSKIVEFSIGPKYGEHSSAAKRACGFDIYHTPPPDSETFRLGKEMCTGKECLPYQLIWGSFLKYLRENPPDGDKKVLLNDVTGCGPCRNGMFPLADEIALEKTGLADRVEVMTPGCFGGAPEAAAGRWVSMVCTDILNQLRLWYRPVENRPGEADGLFDEFTRRITEILEKQSDGGFFKPVWRKWKLIMKNMEEASAEFRELRPGAAAGENHHTVYLCGDIFLRVDEWASDDLARKLNDMGLRVLIEPFGKIAEFLMLYRSKELVELEDRWLPNRLMLALMKITTAKIVETVSKAHPWVSWERYRDIDRASKALTDGVPFAESITIIGSALNAWETKPVDGIVVVVPWGCGPGLISEAQLRRRTDIPIHFVANDGTPIDVTRLAGFVWRIKNRPPRRKPSGFSQDGPTDKKTMP